MDEIREVFAPVIHTYWYGEVPPPATAVAEPFVLPLQKGLVPLTEIVGLFGDVRVALAEFVHPLESVIVTE